MTSTERPGNQQPISPYQTPQELSTDASLISRSRNVMLLFFCLAALIAYVQRTAVGMVAADVQKSLNVSVEALGWIMSAYYWSYAFSQLPAGFLVRVYGTRIVLPLSVAATSLFTGLTALTTGSSAFAVTWLLAGVSIAGIFPACVRSIGMTFPSDSRAFPSGALASSMSVGAAVSTTMTGLLMVHLASSSFSPWRSIFLIYAVPGLIWAVVFYLWYREPDGSVQATNAPDARIKAADTPAIKRAPALLDKPDWFLDHRAWLISGQQFFRAAGYVFYATWFPGYLKEVHHVSLASAGLLTSLPLLAVVVGGVSGGVLCDWIERSVGSRRLARQGTGIVCHALCGLLILRADAVTSPLAAVSLISAGSLIFALGSSGSYAINMDLGGSRAPTLFAAMNMSGNIGAALSPVVVGWIVHRAGWSAVLPFFGGLYLAAALCWMFLNSGNDRSLLEPEQQP